MQNWIYVYMEFFFTLTILYSKQYNLSSEINFKLINQSDIPSHSSYEVSQSFAVVHLEVQRGFLLVRK
jgi:hypothetical protein